MEWLNTISTHFWAHWPFFGCVIMTALVGNVSAHSIFTKERACRNDIYAIGRMTLPFHPVLAGAILGLLVRHPEAGVSYPQSVLYFATAGALSLWAFEAVRRVTGAKGSPFDVTPWCKDDN